MLKKHILFSELVGIHVKLCTLFGTLSSGVVFVQLSLHPYNDANF